MYIVVIFGFFIGVVVFYRMLFFVFRWVSIYYGGIYKVMLLEVLNCLFLNLIKYYDEFFENKSLNK